MVEPCIAASSFVIFRLHPLEPVAGGFGHQSQMVVRKVPLYPEAMGHPPRTAACRFISADHEALAASPVIAAATRGLKRDASTTAIKGSNPWAPFWKGFIPTEVFRCLSLSDEFGGVLPVVSER